MKSCYYRHFLPFFLLFISILLSGCAAQKSVIVLLPEDGKTSGEVTVVNAQGSQVLSQAWQSVEIAGTHGQPTPPIEVNEPTVQNIFGDILTAMPLQPIQFLLYFNQGSTELRPDSQLILPAIVKAIKERHPAQLSVIGHTDTMGTDKFNYQLGLLRASSIVELLASQGAAPESIETSSRGNTNLLVKTAGQTPEPRNRRAEITIR